MDVLPNEVTVADTVSTHGDAHTGVLVRRGDGSIFLEGISKSQMAQDNFMFNAVAAVANDSHAGDVSGADRHLGKVGT